MIKCKCGKDTSIGARYSDYCSCGMPRESLCRIAACYQRQTGNNWMCEHHEYKKTLAKGLDMDDFIALFK